LQHFKVQKIFLPLLEPVQKKIMLVSYLITGGQPDDFVYKFINDPLAAVLSVRSEDYQNIIPVINVEIGPPDSDPGEENLDAIFDSIPSGTKIKVDKYIKWVYIPYNFEQDKRCEPIKKYIDENEMPDPPDANADEMGEWWKKHKSKLIDIYKKIRGDLNTNSMVVYSGPPISDGPKSGGEKAGCLYMGDYNARGKTKFSTLQKAYKDYFKNIHTLQIPHHGSHKSYNSDLITMLGAQEFVVSFGAKNRCSHPHEDVLEDIAQKKNMDNLHKVDESRATQYWEVVFWEIPFFNDFEIWTMYDMFFDKLIIRIGKFVDNYFLDTKCDQNPTGPDTVKNP
jgi:hypothetical protein